MTTATSTASLTRRFSPILLIWIIAVWTALGLLSDSLSTFARFTVALVVVVSVAWLVVRLIASREERSWLLTVTFIAILVRITFALTVNSLIALEDFPYLMGNSKGYDNKSWTWAVAGGWAFPDIRFPGFVYTLGIMYRLFGPETQSQYILLVFLALGGGLIVPFTYKFAEPLLGQRTAQVAIWIVALLPEFIFHSSVLIRDQLTALGLSIALYGASRILAGHPASGIIAGMLGIGLAYFYNPIFGFATLVIWAGILIAMPGRFAPSRLTPMLLIALSVVIFLNATSVHVLDLNNVGERERLEQQGIVQSDVIYYLNGEYLKGKFESLSENERTSQIYFDSSLARRILLGLPPGVSIGGQVFWGAFMPAIPVAAYYGKLAQQIGFFVRTVGWQLTLPFVAYGAFTFVRSGGASRTHMVLAIAAIGIVVIPAVGTVADLWDGPRYRSFGAPVLACIAALGWVRGLETRSLWLKSLLIGTFTLHVSYLAVSFVRHGSGERIISTVVDLNLVGLTTSLTSLLVNDFGAVMILIIFSVGFWYIMKKVFGRGRAKSEAGTI